ncbi:hypothetical protein [Anaerotignum propionicum]|uniref:hypothetical protein n=1 Tax=Anaerotignum propionicum TaxID=28446 RepID=UPI003AB97584
MRAGSAGKGFTVVADEFRNLARKSVDVERILLSSLKKQYKWLSRALKLLISLHS